MDIQKEFEAWYKDHHHEELGSFDGEYYANSYQHTLWVGWQAAKASVPAISNEIRIGTQVKIINPDDTAEYGVESGDEGVVVWVSDFDTVFGVCIPVKSDVWAFESHQFEVIANEVQVQASVTEGFVLVKRDFTNAAAYAAKSVDGRLSAFKYGDVWNAMVEAQEQSAEQPPNIKYDTTYVIEVVGYTQIEDARNLLNQKGYKTWDFTDKENIDGFSTYIICACPTLSNEGVVLAKQTYASLDQSKFKYVLANLEDFPLAQEPSND